MKIVPASIEIISTEPYEEMLKRVERAGRVCYKSEGSIEDGSAERFIRNILKRGHESVIEHAGITVKVTCVVAPTFTVLPNLCSMFIRKLYLSILSFLKEPFS